MIKSGKELVSVDLLAFSDGHLPRALRVSGPGNRAT